jgi:glycosyltransferase involved in cell wall biosynthesis
MIVQNSPKICLVPKLSGLGGMVSFQRRLTKGLQSHGVEVSNDLNDDSHDAVLVVGGTRHLYRLWQTNKKRIPIIQRLDGMNWLHRVQSSRLRHYLRAEYGNLILRIIRNQLANDIVYQSFFARDWWNRVYPIQDKPSTIIYNGVDLGMYSPYGPEQRPQGHLRLLVVEGNVMGGYEWGLENAIHLAILISKRSKNAHSHIELMIVGRVAQELQSRWNNYIKDFGEQVSLTWSGVVPQDEIPGIDRTAHLLYSSDVNPACPNSVIEALACGVPVVAFDTGALPELVAGDAGRVVPYGGDPWKLEQPDLSTLEAAACELLGKQERFRNAARERAEDMFGLDRMVSRYLEVLLK